MNILITGANFENKGAQLMLVTLINVINRKFPDAAVCVSPLLGDHQKLGALNVKLLNFHLHHYGDSDKFPLFIKHPSFMNLLLRLKGKKVKGDISLKDIDIVFDISGFAFGDKWGSLPVKNLNLMVKKMKSYGAKFIFLPQAFGPFTSQEIRASMKEVIMQADLVVARDKASYEHMAGLVNNKRQNLLQFPDITLTQKVDDGDIPSVLQPPYCAIVPNERMLDKASRAWQEHYQEVLLEIIKIVVENDHSMDVVLLVHAQGNSKDAAIAEELVEKIGHNNRVRIVQEDDPLRLKGIIAGSQFIIGSRFHALASALSSNVPCIATSWLHKYEMLFEEYGQKDFSFKEPDRDIYAKVEDLLIPEKRETIIERLRESNNMIAEKNKEMWNLIESISLQ